MNHDLFGPLVLGHLVGDYLLQNKWMAMNKSASSWRCLVHCLLYTASVVGLTWPVLHGGSWTIAIFASHYPIDRWSLADKWLDLIGGRSMEDFMANGKKGIPDFVEQGNYWALRSGFTAVVYTVTDNTLHLLILWCVALFLK